MHSCDYVLSLFQELQLLLTRVRETLANINANAKPEVPASTAKKAPQLPRDTAQTSLQPKPAITRSPPAPVTPPATPTHPPGQPQLTLHRPTQPQQGGAVAPAQLPQAPIQGQEVVISAAPAPLGPLLPQAGLAIPVTMPSQDVQLGGVLPNQDHYMQNTHLAQFYLPPVAPLPGQVQYLYINPYMGPYMSPYTSPYLNPYSNYRSYTLPAVAFTPPVVFREPGAAANSPAGTALTPSSARTPGTKG